MAKIIINTDGGSRGNPGPAAIGVVITQGDGKIEKKKRFIGIATNNQAEYRALLFACHLLEGKVKSKDEVEFVLDSELVVKQMKGEYKVKDKNLAVIKMNVENCLNLLNIKTSFKHVKREKNKDADALVNEALDNA